MAKILPPSAILPISFFISDKAVNFRFQNMRFEIASFYHHGRSAFGVSVSVFSLVFLAEPVKGMIMLGNPEAAISKIDPLPALDNNQIRRPVSHSSSRRIPEKERVCNGSEGRFFQNQIRPAFAFIIIFSALMDYLIVGKKPGKISKRLSFIFWEPCEPPKQKLRAFRFPA